MIYLDPSTKIYIAKSSLPSAGRGVFAKTNIKKGEMIEQCPVIEITEKDAELISITHLKYYTFHWGFTHKKKAILLGYGSLYNHSFKPNADYNLQIDHNIMDFLAIKDILKNEEITVNYDYGEVQPQWMIELAKNTSK